MTDTAAMQLALAQASQAFASGEIPIGAVIIREHQVIASGYNQREATQNPLKHAEMVAIEAAAKSLGYFRLVDCELYVTCEPCLMCLGAALNARIRRLIFGCYDPKRSSSKGVAGCYEFASLAGMTEVSGLCHNMIITGGVLVEPCSSVLQDFFKLRRNLTAGR